MKSPDLLDRLRAELARRGVAQEYCDRLIAELLDHYHGAIEAHQKRGLPPADAASAALADLGDERDLLRTALRSLRRDTFLGRHRIFFLIVAPVLLYPVILGLLLLPGAWLAVRLIESQKISQTGLTAQLCRLLLQSEGNVLVPLSALWLLTRLDRRRICGKPFHYVARAAVFAWSLLLYTSMQLQDSAHSRVSLGVGMRTRWLPISPDQIAWLLIYFVALLGAWAIARRRQVTLISTSEI